MYSIKRTPLAAALLLALNSPLYSPTANAIPAPTTTAAIGPMIGAEFPVNTHTSLSQKSPSVAMDATGDYVVVWQSAGQDGSGYGVYAQRYHADGTVNGGEFPVNTTASGDQTNPKVAMDDAGDFVIVWEDSAQDGDGLGVYGRLYNANGTAATGEFRVNTNTVGIQFTPAVAMDAGGDFVVAWDSCTANCATNASSQDGSYDGIFAQRYDSTGNPVNGEFQVNIYTAGAQVKPSVAMDATGDFVIAWSSAGDHEGTGTYYGIYARRYNAAGVPDVNEIHVNSWITGDQENSSVAMDAAGDFVITWQSANQDGTLDSIYAQRYDAAGVASPDGEFKVSSYSTSFQTFPSVAMDTNGDFVITWQSYGQDTTGGGAVEAQRYNADGTVSAGEFQVNTYTTSDQGTPGVAMDDNGDFVIAWQSKGQDDTLDTSSYGIEAQRYAGTADLNLVVTDDTDPVTVGNNFVYTLTTTNNGAGTAIDVKLSEPLPTGLTYVSDDSATSGWTCSLSVATISCDKPYMTAGEISTINVTVTADTVTTLSNTVTLSSAQTDSNPADNTDTETTVVQAAATTTTTTTPSSGGGGSLGVFTLLLAVPLWLRRRWMR